MVKDAGDDKSANFNMTQASKLSATPSNIVSNILQMNPDRLNDASMEKNWNSLFTLRLSMLPTSYIPASLGDKILFIGKAVKVLQSNQTPPEDRIPTSEL